MKHRFISAALAASILLSTAGASLANDDKADATGETGHKAVMKGSMHGKAVKRKPVARFKQVDINAAGKAELMKLPGIGSQEAERIIAGRPYGSQAWLVSNKVIPEDLYLRIKDRIIAIQHRPIGKVIKSK